MLVLPFVVVILNYLRTTKSLLIQRASNTNCRYLQFTASNVMHFLFNLLRIKDLYMFRTSLAQPKEVAHKRHLVYYVLKLVDI
jgi:hypothetical protein